MALSLKKLERSLVKNFEDIRENGATEKESADGMANAIGEYAKDAEALVPTPFLQLYFRVIKHKTHHLQLFQVV